MPLNCPHSLNRRPWSTGHLPSASWSCSSLLAAWPFSLSCHWGHRHTLLYYLVSTNCLDQIVLLPRILLAVSGVPPPPYAAPQLWGHTKLCKISRICVVSLRRTGWHGPPTVAECATGLVYLVENMGSSRTLRIRGGVAPACTPEGGWSVHYLRRYSNQSTMALSRVTRRYIYTIKSRQVPRAVPPVVVPTELEKVRIWEVIHDLEGLCEATKQTKFMCWWNRPLQIKFIYPFFCEVPVPSNNPLAILR